MTKKERSFLLFILLIFLLFQILPYLYGFIIQGPDKVFSGFIMRWNDNNTYLAKMEQGFDGHWRFTFDYALEPHDSAFIYPLYLGLGHLVRILHLDYLFTFHFMRILAGILMFFSLYRYISASFKDTPSRTKRNPPPRRSRRHRSFMEQPLFYRRLHQLTRSLPTQRLLCQHPLSPHSRLHLLHLHPLPRRYSQMASLSHLLPP